MQSKNLCLLVLPLLNATQIWAELKCVYIYKYGETTVLCQGLNIPLVTDERVDLTMLRTCLTYTEYIF
jgi:hypothetical protein